MGDTFFVENTQHRNGIYVKCSLKQGCILFECTVHAVKLVNLVFFSLKMGRVRENIMGHSFTSREVSNVIEVFFNECCLANDIVTKRLFFIMSCFREMGLTVCGQSEPENQSKIYPLPPYKDRKMIINNENFPSKLNKSFILISSIASNSL